VLSPHGVPLDLLDRMLIIRTMPYSIDEMVHILAIRAQVRQTEADDTDEPDEPDDDSDWPQSTTASHQTQPIKQAEGLEVEEEALTALGEVGAKGSLRYAVQMLTPARILAETYGREKVSVADVKEVDALFHDAKASARLLARTGDQGWLK
jgi:RuvB-like protein 1 (pontin 52)